MDFKELLKEIGDWEEALKANFEVTGKKNGKRQVFYVASEVFDGVTETIRSAVVKNGYTDVFVRMI